MKNMRKNNRGFILPTVVTLSLSVITVVVALLVLTSSTYKGSSLDSYQKLADEAAEAGTAYATACLTLSSHTQTWGPAAGKSNLTPNSDCSGTNSYPSNTYVYSSSSVRSYFVVGDLDYTYPFSAQISAQGYVDILTSSGGVAKTLTSIRKKVITWPTDISGQMSVSGTNRTCAIVSSKVYCWGYNAYGQLGDGRYLGTGNIENSSSVDSLIPVKVRQDTGVLAGKTIVKIFVAQYHTCALSSDGLMYCWGYNYKGELGQGNTTDSPVAVQVGGALAGKTITDIGGTNDVSCAIASGKIYCWGNNAAGVTGLNTTSGYTNTPTLVTASNTATTLPTAYTATTLSTSGSRGQTMCAIISTGKVYCWGSNYAGSVGDGTSGSSNQYRTVPTKVIDTGVLNGKTVTAVSQDGYYPATGSTYPHVCALASGSLYCWGDNSYGQLGNNSTTDSSVPVAVTASGVLNGKTITDIKVGLNHSCALASGGDYCWGLNTYGQVGDASNTNRSTPVAVAQQSGNLSASNVISIGAGSNRGCAVITDGRTFCWGYNGSGQIGDGTTTNRNVPTESLFLRPLGNQYIF
jgi:alpha-tubulin suppressor-like RCC1 family protein